ncbi:MAG TPA: hypothetical protein VFX20_12795 [Steroidobacteraceae bacterium]|nr:hypothetical protein [Steroidobacteraceae bacterium]
MRLSSIIVSLLIVAAAYVYVSKREGTYVNVLTASFVMMIPAEYLLQMYYLLAVGDSNSVYAYVLSYGTFAAYTTAFALAYTWIRMPAIRLPFGGYEAGRSRLPAYLLLAAAICLYLPVLIKFRADIADPREIYRETRTGYGVYFFLSLTLAYLAFILLLFAKRVGKIELSMFFLLCIGFTWLQGSKGHMLGFVFILALHWVYVQHRRIRLFKFLIFTAAMALFGLMLFIVTTPDLILGGGLQGLAAYSDYTRNGMLVIDSGMGPFYGRLTLENQFYPRIPRVLDPGKPKDFGDLYLAEHFYPDQFVTNVGAPAFANGTWYADFGVMALPLQLVAGILSGMMLKMFMRSLQRYGSPGDFIMVLFACGVPLITLGSTFLLPESLLLAVIANALFCLRVRRRRPLPPGAESPPLLPAT